MHSPTSCSRYSFLVCGQASVHALLPSTLDAQVESLLENGKIKEAEALLEKGEPSTSQDIRFRQATSHFVKGAVDPRVLITFFEKLRPALLRDNYIEVDMYAGVHKYMPSEASVDDIITINLVRNYSPYLRPQMQVGAADAVDSDGATPLPKSVSGTRTHPATVAMQDELCAQAREMVKTVLSAVLEGQIQIWSKEVIEIVSTALALHHAHSRDIPSLLVLFRLPPPPQSISKTISTPLSKSLPQLPSSRHHSLPSETPQTTSHLTFPPGSSPQPSHMSVMGVRPHVIAPILAQLGLWGSLIELWKATGEVARVMGTLADLVEGTCQDPSVPDPLDQMCSLLSALQQPGKPNFDVQINTTESERRSLVRKWGTWLAIRDVEKGLSFLTSESLIRAQRFTATGGLARERDSERETADELAVLIDLKRVQPAAAKRYLEWLVVIRGQEDPSLQNELAESCLGELSECLKDEAVTKLWRAKAASYASSTAPAAYPPTCSPPQAASLPSVSSSTGAVQFRPPFLSYFVSTTPDSPSKRVRVKALLALQVALSGSAPEAVAKRLQGYLPSTSLEKVLGLEMAILESKLSPPTEVFRALHLLGDNATAEGYACSGGKGGIISPNIGSSAAEGCSLADWAKWFAKMAEDKGPGRQDPRMRGNNSLLKALVQVYMEDGDIQQASRLLNSQARQLDIVDILPLVPTAWPIQTLSPFFIRTLRRSLHEMHEGQTFKALCAGQSLEVFENSFAALRDEGAIIEEADDDKDQGATIKESFDEKGGLAEKVAIQLKEEDIPPMNVDTRDGAGG